MDLINREYSAHRPGFRVWGLVLLGSLGLAVGCIALLLALNKDRIAVVRTLDLVEKYRGMEDARARFEKQRLLWQAELDTLRKDYGVAANALETEWEGLSKREKEERQELVAQQEENLARFTRSMEMQIRAEEGRLEGDVIGKVNDIIKTYAAENDYDVIFGATENGSILHSVDALDITDELIEVLNRNYKSPMSDDTGSQ